MSITDELLDSLDETTETESGNIVIGLDRFITVPESMKKLGVQYDHNVETVTFDCPRYWDGHDLSVLNVYVIYMRSDKVSGSHPCTNVVIDESDNNIMHFDWTISGHVSYAPGPLDFVVCIAEADDEGMTTVHWNSEINTECYISKGLENHNHIVEKYPDIITYVLGRLEQIEQLCNEVTSALEVT